jgi:hypothetical protein
MTTNRQGLLATSYELSPAGDAVSSPQAVSNYSSNNAGVGSKFATGAQSSEADAARESMPRTPSRPLAIWIMIKTLCISIVMIISATVVTARFLA